ncbi:iron-containing alcohol dehydrogenase family protein [Ramlibacter sp.]|uniref:iron-containing alcohol dehydrogenase family protein n=1 Tax=Ramlibacter sp. TaxID=1917967 RepID=UPI003D14D6BD
MKSFRHLVPALRIFHGADCFKTLAAELEREGASRAVIFTGNTLSKPGSPVDLIRAALGERCAGVYAGVKSDSPVPAVEDAARELERLGADAIIAVGGGSAIVTARAAAILLAEKDEVKNLCTRQVGDKQVSPKLLKPKIPQFVVPTTPTTASIKAGSAVLDPVEGTRLPLFDPKTRARALFIHPDFMATASRELVVSASLNTMALALEGLLSPTGDPMSDAMLIHAVRLMSRQIVAASTSDDMQVRSDLMMASLMAGHGTDYTGAGMAIPVGHAIGTRCGIDMGVSDAIMLPHVLRFNAEAAAAGITKLVDALGLRLAVGESEVEAVIAKLEAIFGALGVPKRLRDAGIGREVLHELATIAFGDWYLQNNPRKIRDVAELEGVLEQAW